MSIEWKFKPVRSPKWNPDAAPADGTSAIRLGVISENLAAIAERLGWLCERFERVDAEEVACTQRHAEAAARSLRREIERLPAYGKLVEEGEFEPESGGA